MKLKTIDIRGKSYVMVHERIRAFHELYPKGAIKTEVIRQTDTDILMVSKVYPDAVDSNKYFTGHAFEKNSGGMVNSTSHVENAECVPIDTMILTKEGWKFYNEIAPGDEAFTITEDLKGQWNRIERVSVFKNIPVYEMKTSRFSAICTKDHKWMTSKGLRPMEKMGKTTKIILSIKREIPLGECNISKKLGWLFSDGLVKYTNNGLPSAGEIRQSKKENIKELEFLFGTKTKKKTYNTKWKQAFSWQVKADEVRKILGYFGVRVSSDLPKAVSKMTQIQANSFFDAMIKADGCHSHNKLREFAKTDIHVVESAAIACALLGYKTGKIKERTQEKSTKPLYILPIHQTTGAYFSEIKIKPLPPRDVWCPTTGNGTWLAKQNGQIWMTGNTSAVGRALGFLGIGVETSIATAEEVSNAIKQQEPEIKVYTYNGVKYPHVTAILNPDPLPIPEWHKAVGTQVDLILKAFFAGKGHPINKEGLPPDALKNLDECTEAIQDWLIAFGDKFSDTTFDTRVINHQDVYIGTEDMEAVYEGQYSLIDFKKTKNLDKKMTAHYFMQMAAYAKAQRFDNKERKPIEQLVIASPFNDPVVTTDIDKYYALFLEKRAEFKKRFKL
jgi:hypothetical protein